MSQAAPQDHASESLASQYSLDAKGSIGDLQSIKVVLQIKKTGLGSFSTGAELFWGPEKGP